MSGARHDHEICGRSLNVGDSPVTKGTSSIACLTGRSGSKMALNPLDSPKSQRAQAILTRSEQAVSEPPFLGPQEFEGGFNVKADRDLLRTKSSSVKDFNNAEKPEGVGIVEQDLEASLVNLTVQDSLFFSPEQTEVPAATTSPTSGKVTEPRGGGRFRPSVDRISENSNETAEQEGVTNDTSLRTFSKRQGGFLDPQSLPTSGCVWTPPNSRMNSPESLEMHSDRSSGASSVKDSDIIDCAIPSPTYSETIPQLNTPQVGELGGGMYSCIPRLCPNPPSPDVSNGVPMSPSAESLTDSESFEDIDEYLEKSQSPRSASVDSRCTSGPPLSLLVERSLDMESPLSGMDSYEFSK